MKVNYKTHQILWNSRSWISVYWRKLGHFPCKTV